MFFKNRRIGSPFSRLSFPFFLCQVPNCQQTFTNRKGKAAQKTTIYQITIRKGKPTYVTNGTQMCLVKRSYLLEHYQLILKKLLWRLNEDSLPNIKDDWNIYVRIKYPGDWIMHSGDNFPSYHQTAVTIGIVTSSHKMWFGRSPSIPCLREENHPHKTWYFICWRYYQTEFNCPFENCCYL